MSAITLRTFAFTSLVSSAVLVRQFSHLTLSLSYILAVTQLFVFELLLFLTWRMVLQPHYFSPLRHLPQPSGNNLFVGQWPRLLREPIGAPMAEWVRTIPNDGLIRYLDMFNVETIIPTSTRALSEVLTVKSDEFIKPPKITKALRHVFGSGLVFVEGEVHKNQRRNLMPAFSFRHIKNLYPTFWSKSCEFIELLTVEVQKNHNHTTPDGKSRAVSVVNISAWLSSATLDILGVAGFGHDFEALSGRGTELKTAYAKVFSPSKVTQLLASLSFIFPRWFVRGIPVKRNGELEEAAAVIKKVCRELVQNSRAKVAETGKTDVDILSIAMESGFFSDDDLADQLMTLLAAGHESTAASTIWAVCLLSKHPDMQSRLRNDIRAALPSPRTPHKDPPSPLSIDQIPYLNAVCNEVFRFCPAAATTWRQVAGHGTTIAGQPIPKGTRIALSPWATNRDPAHWGPDAGVFNPERWMGPGRANSGGAKSNYSFLTFLHGPRSCIGTNFSKAEFASLLAVMVGRFEMELEDPERELAPRGGLTSQPKNVRLRLRVVDGW